MRTLALLLLLSGWDARAQPTGAAPLSPDDVVAMLGQDLDPTLARLRQAFPGLSLRHQTIRGHEHVTIQAAPGLTLRAKAGVVTHAAFDCEAEGRPFGDHLPRDASCDRALRDLRRALGHPEDAPARGDDLLLWTWRGVAPHDLVVHLEGYDGEPLTNEWALVDRAVAELRGTPFPPPLPPGTAVEDARADAADATEATDEVEETGPSLARLLGTLGQPASSPDVQAVFRELGARDVEPAPGERDGAFSPDHGIRWEVMDRGKVIVAIRFQRDPVGDPRWTGQLPAEARWDEPAAAILERYPPDVDVPQGDLPQGWVRTAYRGLWIEAAGAEQLAELVLSVGPLWQARIDAQLTESERARIAANEAASGFSCSGDCVDGQARLSRDGGTWHYEGQVAYGLPDGGGVMVGPGFTLSGTWRDGVAVGEARLTKDDGTRWIGPVDGFVPHGVGTMITHVAPRDRALTTTDDLVRIEVRGRMDRGDPVGEWEGTVDGRETRFAVRGGEVVPVDEE